MALQDVPSEPIEWYIVFYIDYEEDDNPPVFRCLKTFRTEQEAQSWADSKLPVIPQLPLSPLLMGVGGRYAREHLRVHVQPHHKWLQRLRECGDELDSVIDDDDDDDGDDDE